MRKQPQCTAGASSSLQQTPHSLPRVCVFHLAFQQFLLIAFLLPIPACLTVYVSAFSLPDTLPCDQLPSRVPTLDWNDYELCRCLSPVELLYPCLDCRLQSLPPPSGMRPMQMAGGAGGPVADNTSPHLTGWERRSLLAVAAAAQSRWGGPRRG
ncbi:unnamed protein product [Pleuronectes platessa]|uniref:Uncharacterized protein n=1 Tax=Pleuronectes platessa TaxID=8262 RepID=A0A9N7TIQ2_PLEPL|nr:unnamed protein product [Pleuronectes platessa]